MHDRRVTILLTALMFMSGADLLIMTPILPQLSRELGVDVEMGGLWVTAYGGATALFALLFGPVSDAKGRKPVLVAGMLTMGLGTLACGLATGFSSMLAARMLAGAGSGLLVTSTTSYVGDHYEPAARAEAMGYVMGGFFLSLILGVPLGAWLTAWVGWKFMFFVFSGGVFIVALGLHLGLPSPRYENKLGKVALGAALSAYARLLRDRKVLGILIMSLGIGLSMTMFSVYSSPWMAEQFGLDTAERGLVYAIGGPAVFLGGPLAGRLSNAVGRVSMVVAGSSLMAVMQIVISQSHLLGASIGAGLGASLEEFATFGSVPWPIAAPTVVSFFLIMVAGSSRSAPFQTLAIEVVSAEDRGALAAVRNSFNQTGSALGAALGGLIWAGAAESRYTWLCGISAGLGLGGVLVMRVLVGRDPPRDHAPSFEG